MSGPGPASGPSSRILAAVTPVFGELGYEAASTRKLARAADCNVATLAYHFGDKEGLYLAVLDAQCARLLAFEIPQSLSGPPAARVRTLCAALYRFARRERDAIKILSRHALQHGQLPAALRARWTERSLERMAAVEELLGIPVLGRRLELLTLNHLFARYAIAADEAIEPFVDGPAEAAVAAHLGEVAAQLLVPAPP